MNQMTHNPVHFVILYHSGCMDGTAAAACCYGLLSPSDVEGFPSMIPVDYTTNLDDVFEGLDPAIHHVIMVDFSPEKDVYDKLRAAWGNRLSIWDHHESRDWLAKESSAEDVVSYGHLRLPSAMFEKAACGATLAWHVLRRTYEMPILLSYIRDRDLWEWELPFSREVSAGLNRRQGVLDGGDSADFQVLQ